MARDRATLSISNEADYLLNRVMAIVRDVRHNTPGKLPEYLQRRLSRANLMWYLCERFLARHASNERHKDKLWNTRVELARQLREYEEETITDDYSE